MSGMARLPEVTSIVESERRRLLDHALDVPASPVWTRIIESATTRALAEDARVARLIAIGQAVDAATVGAAGSEVRIAGRYVWSAAAMLERLREVGT